MWQPHQPGEASRELAALYAAGAMPATEAAEFELHLREGCTACASELQSLQATVAQLAFAAPPAAPPADLRARLMHRIAEDSSRGATLPGLLFRQAGLLISRPSEMDWQSGAVAGVLSKPLFVDESRGYATALVRMTAGTRYPSHRHKDVEELYLLEGDLNVGGIPMRPGDYCRAEPESVHGEVFTQTGALFVVLSSTHDELLA